MTEMTHERYIKVKNDEQNEQNKKDEQDEQDEQDEEDEKGGEGYCGEKIFFCLTKARRKDKMNGKGRKRMKTTNRTKKDNVEQNIFLLSKTKKIKGTQKETLYDTYIISSETTRKSKNYFISTPYTY